MSTRGTVRMSDLNHGTPHAYKKGCRCSECKAAKRAAAAVEYQRRKQREITGDAPPPAPGRPTIPLSERPHGSYVTYAKGCRCVPCTTANTEYGRERRALRELEEWERTGSDDLGRHERRCSACFTIHAGEECP